MPKQVDRQLLEKYLNNNCSLEEQALVIRFLKQPESETLLNEILTDRSEEDFALFQKDNTTNIKLPDWQAAMNERTADPVHSVRNPGRKPFFMRYAAIWIALVSIGLLIYSIPYFKKNRPEAAVAFIERSNPNGRRSMVILSDSTVIYLGAGSRIKYPEIFNGNTREISLYGEAFFQVKKNPKKPFIIHTGDIQTKVLGTSFKIEAFKNRPMAVEVATGKVRVDRYLNKKLKSLAVLTPGQKVIWDKGQAKTGSVAVDDVRMWKDARLVFNNSSLNEIAEVLERWYNLDIIFRKPAKSRERMTVILDANVSADKILNVLAAAGHFSYKMKEREIIIK